MQQSSSKLKPFMKSKRLKPWWMRRGRYWYYRLARLQGSPEAIARGVAVGVFSGFFPLFGLQTLIGLLLATLVQGNKIAAAAGTWVSNPLTYVPLFAMNYRIGRWLLGGEPMDFSQISGQSLEQLLDMGGDVAGRLFFGCFVMGVMVACGSYSITVRLFYRLRASHHKHRKYYLDD
ncbi:DUF2062 domain-containing protein [Spirulina subsalsa FACHB-351]|uniref:DUF2062 domain-containing protein n=2 Tax=Spirulina subsalsa TaxID=54311 RepID=A0ABT3L9T4_9CYAN|nr:DUF2062 domain-containing protein [Spirulina subsalsa FACHB-351]